jgi:peptidoglycan lytic transglycosylase
MIEEGNASWYGVPYHGRKAANGEIYDMYKLTAAHRTLPFETIVRVTNLRNGKQTQVRITDRGPFVEGRIIDLSLAAAREIDMVGTGVARVRLEFVNGPPDMVGAFTVQVGAFLQKENAVRMRQSLERRYQPVFVAEYDSPKGMFYRVRVGRVPNEAAADRLADKLKSQEQLSTFVVRLDEIPPQK